MDTEMFPYQSAEYVISVCLPSINPYLARTESDVNNLEPGQTA